MKQLTAAQHIDVAQHFADSSESLMRAVALLTGAITTEEQDRLMGMSRQLADLSLHYQPQGES